VALDACPTRTSTLLDATSIGKPLAVMPATPPTWASTVTAQGYDVGLNDATVRLVVASGIPTQVVAGSHNQQCPNPTQPCGDGGPATQALLGSPNGLAVGLDGSLYIADPTLHRVRRIDPAGIITTVAGTGESCSGPSSACGDGGPATAAALSGPYGVWASPGGELFIADGTRGIREVLPNGNITTIGPAPGSYDVVSVAGDAADNLYAATNNPDYLIQVKLAEGQVTTIVGTGTSGYNGNSDKIGNLLPGTQVQIDHPQGLSVALNGDVVFADTGNHLIRAYVPPPPNVSYGTVTDPLGGLVSNSGVPQGGFNGDGCWADQTEFDNPAAVTVTLGALLVVADTGNARLRQIGPTPTTESTTCGGGGAARQPGPKAPPPNTGFKSRHQDPSQRNHQFRVHGSRARHGRRTRNRPE
jgi:hypothetical protein